MPAIRQHRVHRADLRANRHALYLFGDNEQRLGMGGQAGEMRGEPNAVGVRTKREPHNGDAAFWSDADFDRQRALIDEDLAAAFAHARDGGLVVVPLDGLGTGLSELHIRAPRTLEYLEKKLSLLAATQGALLDEAQSLITHIDTAVHHDRDTAEIANWEEVRTLTNALREAVIGQELLTA